VSILLLVSAQESPRHHPPRVKELCRRVGQSAAAKHVRDDPIHLALDALPSLGRNPAVCLAVLGTQVVFRECRGGNQSLQDGILKTGVAAVVQAWSNGTRCGSAVMSQQQWVGGEGKRQTPAVIYVPRSPAGWQSAGSKAS